MLRVGTWAKLKYGGLGQARGMIAACGSGDRSRTTDLFKEDFETDVRAVNLVCNLLSLYSGLKKRFRIEIYGQVP